MKKNIFIIVIIAVLVVAPGLSAEAKGYLAISACVVVGYRSVHTIIAFKTPGAFEYYFLGVRLALIP